MLSAISGCFYAFFEPYATFLFLNMLDWIPQIFGKEGSLCQGRALSVTSPTTASVSSIMSIWTTAWMRMDDASVPITPLSVWPRPEKHSVNLRQSGTSPVRSCLGQSRWTNGWNTGWKRSSVPTAPRPRCTATARSLTTTFHRPWGTFSSKNSRRRISKNITPCS